MLKTKDGRSLAVEKLSWQSVISAITPTNPSLAKAIAVLDDNRNYAFYKASYRFGDSIINNEKCYLPLQSGGSIAFDDPNLPDELYNDLNYHPDEDPLGIILSKNSEFYLSSEEGVQTQSIIHPGQMFGIPKAIDDINSFSTSALEFNLNAGSRSLFVLSKISDNIEHGKIKKHFGITLPAPSTSQEHWALLVDIANKANSPWRSEVIYFSREWIRQLKRDEWAVMAKRLTELHRASYSIWHNASATWNKTFAEIEQDKKLSKYYSMSSINAAKQLFMLSGNISYGFEPATNEDAAPINLFIDVYTNIYNKLIKQNHRAIIMEVAKLKKDSPLPIYYSINHTLSTQNDLEVSKQKSQIARLDEIRRVKESYTKAILEEKSNIQSLYEVAKNIVFSYYHSNPEKYNKINNAALIATEDNRFTDGKIEGFPVTSLFFKGCIKISNPPDTVG